MLFDHMHPHYPVLSPFPMDPLPLTNYFPLQLLGVFGEKEGDLVSLIRLKNIHKGFFL